MLSHALRLAFCVRGNTHVKPSEFLARELDCIATRGEHDASNFANEAETGIRGFRQPDDVTTRTRLETIRWGAKPKLLSRKAVQRREQREEEDEEPDEQPRAPGSTWTS